MRSLFLKIFLWFWLAMVLVGLALVITWSMQPELIVGRWRAATGDAISLYAQTAAEEYDRYGPQGLGNYLQRLDASTHIRAALLDQAGRALGGKVAPNTAELVERAESSGQPEFSIGSGVAYAADRTTGPSGRGYVFVAEMQRGPFAFRLSARTQALRLGLAILISGFICYLLTLYLTRPILRLRTASRHLAAGDLSARADPQMERRRDELGDLVHDFNRMAERLELLVNSQRQLISDISHELRSPLARLSVALGLARQRAGAEATAPLDRIEREAERLNEMIGRLLALARMQAASGPPERALVELRELLAEIAEDAGFEAQERGCTVQLMEDGAPGTPAAVPCPCTVLGSAELLRSALENVVRNAVRYTAEGSQVDVHLACSNGWAHIDVRDHGPGVAESELVNLFRPFYRVANARERQTGGTGLGLAITERAVRLHGGTVVAQNASNGGGLVVVLKVPAS